MGVEVADSGAEFVAAAVLATCPWRASALISL